MQILFKTKPPSSKYPEFYESPTLTGTFEEIIKDHKYRPHVSLTYLEAMHLGFPKDLLSGCEKQGFGTDFEFNPLNMWGLYWRRTPWRNITVGEQYNQLRIQTEIWLHMIPYICFYWTFDRVIKSNRIEEITVASVHEL